MRRSTRRSSRALRTSPAVQRSGLIDRRGLVDGLERIDPGDLARQGLERRPAAGAGALTSRAKRATLAVMNGSRDGLRGRWTTLPGYEIVDPGVRDLWRGDRTVEALMVTICADRLRAVGVGLPPTLPPDPVDAVHGLLDRQVGDEAHGRYNALLDRMLSFLDGVEESVR